jgi:hypothetical protein
MKAKLLRTLAALIIFGAVVAWAAAGANRGWTRTSIPVQHTDEVTGITVDVYEDRFVPGVDMLGAAFLGAGVLAGVSFLFRKKPTLTPH